MPALPAVPKTLLVKMFWTIGQDTRGLTRFYVSYTGTPPTQAQAATYATSVFTAAGTNLAPLMPSANILTQTEAIDLNSNTGANGVSTGSTAGSRAGTVLPGATSALENDQIQRRYRGGHPKLFWPFGVGADLTAEQQWTAGALTAFNNGLNAFFSAILAAGATWSGGGTLGRVNVSYYNGFTVVTSPTTGRTRNVPKVRANPVVDVLTTGTVNPKPSYQRRRGLHSV